MSETIYGSGHSDSLGEGDSLHRNFNNDDSEGHPIYEFEEGSAAEDRNAWMGTSGQTHPRVNLPTHYLAEKTNKSLISSSLKHIYCDTLENALVCWVTEQNCPYNNEGIDRHRGRVQDFGVHNEGTVRKYGMIRRIQRLDRPSCVLSERPLTPRECQLASHALQASIMAFAAQWSQLSGASAFDLFNGRGVGDSNQFSKEFQKLIEASLFDFAEAKLASFDRSLQETLWNEARRALQQTSGIDSFQVAFAQVLFAFTQKPLSNEDFQRMKDHGKGRTDYYGSSIAAEVASRGLVWSDDESDSQGRARVGGESSTRVRPGSVPNSTETQELLDMDKDSLHIRESLMRLSARRVKLSGMNPRHDKYAGSAGVFYSPPYEVDAEVWLDRMTFNQLFWLVMLCDTLSATINNRLPVVSDEDSVILSEDQMKSMVISETLSETDLSLSSADTHTNVPMNPWGMYFLGRNVRPTGPVNYSLEKEAATALLREAAPVKAVLFRKIKQIQNARFRRTHPQRLEQTILDALKVYEYWNEHYGNFISTCIDRHDELAVQIQSWYSVLTSHWNLACFLLSDLIEDLDKTGESDERHCAIRRSCGLLFHIRKQSAFEMAELGKVGKVREGCSFGQSDDFHPTVNDGALLTEPWTEIMIRSFARVSEQFLTWLGEIDPTSGEPATQRWTPGDFGQLYLSLGHCVEALLDLGRKSDMAFLLAISLKRRMSRFTNTD
ncbi:uncharacterized protein A1O5_09177 [Cladophialophora psammophila CBS 110553]|uniref:Uncharacterized protein n=1 Tax=Cladophialophora psammophila CBS 110553 TaxID=1182543 RepID=W9WT69_9EURO|nr:uncharacterized protein A1O5_09177 [Cladophialophora psammophila CBS 110553]EXJ67831.1 hypothetical protein A1O5_09177 [Cladophialophora psammophila CBS 110553]